jgi:hypothetical protein
MLVSLNTYKPQAGLGLKLYLFIIHLQKFIFLFAQFFFIFYTPPNFLKDSNASLKVQTMKEKGIGVCSFVHNTLKR